ncbi:YcxB family protein [Streptomyces sp. NPDC046197]|uniref:YcxB family protein n=1 Tax=Streptomyces sp. NPDC046197 TaxID=3154337 RepID=UPI0033EE6DDD
MVMGMNMGRDAVPETVGLEYRPTAKDFTSALRERRRFSRAGRRGYWAIGAMFALTAVQAATTLTGGKTDWFLLIWPALTAVMLLFMPQLQGRAVQRIAARNGVFRVVVAEAGLTVSADNSSSTINWAAQPRYRETRELFVMYSDDKNATCFTVLPKRGLTGPADVDRLRAILDRNLTRL